MYQRHVFGRESEIQGKDWLLRQTGYRLLVSNYRCRWGEIDLIFEQEIADSLTRLPKTELVFVEVRARAGQGWVRAVESVDWKKQRRLQKTAAYFLSTYSGSAKTMRFDLLYREGESWGHMPNIWFSTGSS